MGRFVARRVIQAVPTLFGITLLSFVVLRLAPAATVSLTVAGSQGITPADLAAMRAAYVLDQPLPIQYLSWLGHLLTGDFGRSFIYKRPVMEMIQASLPNTLMLAGIAQALTVAIGVPMGIIAARFRGSWLDQVIRVVGV